MRRMLLAFACAIAVSSCAESSAKAPVSSPSSAAAHPVQKILMLDFSGSRDSVQLSTARRVASEILDNLGYGDRVAIITVRQHDIREPIRQWHDTMPLPHNFAEVNSFDASRLSSARASAREVLDQFFKLDTAPTQHTDLLTTLYTAAEYVRDAGRRPTTLVILSDMLQSAGGIEMAHVKSMPSANWIEQQKTRGLVPSLTNTCVVAVGPDVTNEQGLLVRAFWEKYFAATGAKLLDQNYRTDVTDVTKLTCP